MPANATTGKGVQPSRGSSLGKGPGLIGPVPSADDGAGAQTAVRPASWLQFALLETTGKRGELGHPYPPLLRDAILSILTRSRVCLERFFRTPCRGCSVSCVAAWRLACRCRLPRHSHSQALEPARRQPCHNNKNMLGKREMSVRWGSQIIISDSSLRREAQTKKGSEEKRQPFVKAASAMPTTVQENPVMPNVMSQLTPDDPD